jgi:hypothetical protein
MLLIRDFKNKMPLALTSDLACAEDYYSFYNTTKRIEKGSKLQFYHVFLNKKIDINKVHSNTLSYGSNYGSMTQVIKTNVVFTAMRCGNDDALCIVDDEGFLKFTTLACQVGKKKLPMKEVKRIFHSLCMDLFFPATKHVKLRNKYSKK